jgi:hypothetical protein
VVILIELLAREPYLDAVLAGQQGVFDKAPILASARMKTAPTSPCRC